MKYLLCGLNGHVQLRSLITFEATNSSLLIEPNFETAIIGIALGRNCLIFQQGLFEHLVRKKFCCPCLLITQTSTFTDTNANIYTDTDINTHNNLILTFG